jgi:predicted HicB family RNase H-like nuclease
MPRRIRQLIADLEKAGFVNRGGKGSHRNFTHSKGLAGDIERQSERRSEALSGTRRAPRVGNGERELRNEKRVMTRKQIKEQAARYTKFVEWSDEDQCFIGRCPEIMLGGVHGNDEAKVYAELCHAVEEMIEVIHADGGELPEPLAGKKFSGKFIVRVEPALHRRLVAKARAAGESLNSYCVKTLVKA